METKCSFLSAKMNLVASSSRLFALAIRIRNAWIAKNNAGESVRYWQVGMHVTPNPRTSIDECCIEKEELRHYGLVCMPMPFGRLYHTLSCVQDQCYTPSWSRGIIRYLSRDVNFEVEKSRLNNVRQRKDFAGQAVYSLDRC